MCAPLGDPQASTLPPRIGIVDSTFEPFGVEPHRIRYPSVTIRRRRGRGRHRTDCPWRWARPLRGQANCAGLPRCNNWTRHCSSGRSAKPGPGRSCRVQPSGSDLQWPPDPFNGPSHLLRFELCPGDRFPAKSRRRRFCRCPRRGCRSLAGVECRPRRVMSAVGWRREAVS